MLFHTAGFGAFFLLAFAAAWVTRARPRLHVWTLIAASFAFYAAWDWRFAFLLAGSGVFNFLAARALEARRGAARRAALTVAVAANLGVLAIFKYLDFFVASFDGLARALGYASALPYAGLILPVGVSFFTFQGVSYVVDVHRGHVAASRRVSEVLLYLSLFPQLVAGPIVRAADLLPQIRARWTPPEGPTAITAGFAAAMILSGLFKKLVLANYIASDLVDEAFFDPALYGAADLWLAAYGYSVQIWCDFSGYSDMAIGLAALLGFSLPKNFDQPFRAASVREFWRRWHISLSTWLRDYLYVPLGGSRGGRLLTARNLFLTMLLGGLWHGAAWTFVIWGALHGAFLVAERAFAPRGIGRALGVVATFHFVVLTFVVFRSESLPLTWEFLTGLARWDQPAELATPFAAALVALGVAMHFGPADCVERAGRALGRLSWPALGVAAGAILALIGALAPDEVTPFIYFQF
jgi:D-alanyl-lipoteichoic acid acyltransferase DltB (MBOAT superfamily)